MVALMVDLMAELMTETLDYLMVVKLGSQMVGSRAEW